MRQTTPHPPFQTTPIFPLLPNPATCFPRRVLHRAVAPFAGSGLRGRNPAGRFGFSRVPLFTIASKPLGSAFATAPPLGTLGFIRKVKQGPPQGGTEKPFTMKKDIRLAIVGGRDFSDYNYLTREVEQLQQQMNIVAIISGGARGADSLGERFANEHHIPKKIFPAQWDLYGRSAGFRRNQTIVDNADVVLAFWDGQSRGTADTINKTRIAKKILIIKKY